MKLFLKLIMPIILVLLVGCSENGSPDANIVDDNATVAQAQKRQEIQRYYDAYEFDTLIEILENSEDYQNAYEDDEYKYYLGLAYAGKLGITTEFIDDSVKNISAKIDDNNITITSPMYLFYGFYEELIALDTEFNFDYAQMAIDLLQESSDVNCSDKDYVDTVEYNQTETCLLIGFISTAKVISTFSKITLVPEPEEPIDKAASSLCASQYAFDTSSTNSDCISLVEDTNITFENNVTYTRLSVTMVDTNNTYDYLLIASLPGTTIRQTARTDGYCTLDDFDTRIDMSHDSASSGYYVCPVNEGGADEELTTEGTLVDVLNNGLDAVIKEVGVNSAVAEDIEKYKIEINPDYNASDENSTISVEDIINYINNSNS